MALDPGTRLGPYEIVSPLGAGGMGEVYKARDTRLDRTVALRVVPPEFGAIRHWFEHDANTISQLNHPHTYVLHDAGQAERPSSRRFSKALVGLRRGRLDGDPRSAKKGRTPIGS